MHGQGPRIHPHQRFATLSRPVSCRGPRILASFAPPLRGREQMTTCGKTSQSPTYIKFERSWYQSAVTALPKIQAAKLSLAIMSFFFEGKEPEHLPKEAGILFEGLRNQIAFKRACSLGKKEGDISAKDSADFPQVPSNNSDDFSRPFSEKLEGTHDVCSIRPTEKPDAETGSSRDNESSSCATVARDSQTACGVSLNSSDNLNEPSLGCESFSDSRTRAPSFEEVASYFRAAGLAVSPNRFFQFNESRGWRDKNGTPIRDWRHMALAWQKHEGRFTEEEAKNASAARKEKALEGELPHLKGRVSSGRETGMWAFVCSNGNVQLLPGSETMNRGQAEALMMETIRISESGRSGDGPS